MPDVVTTATPYLTAAQLLDFHDWRLVADFAGDGTGPRPARAALLSSTMPAGRAVAQMLLAASGEVLASCQAGGRYTPADLAALTGAAAAHLQAVTAGLALWLLARRRSPTKARAEDVPGAAAALRALEELRAGVTIFGLAAAVAAGVPAAIPVTDPADSPGRTVTRAGRYFGTRG